MSVPKHLSKGHWKDAGFLRWSAIYSFYVLTQNTHIVSGHLHIPKSQWWPANREHTCSALHPPKLSYESLSSIFKMSSTCFKLISYMGIIFTHFVVNLYNYKCDVATVRNKIRHYVFSFTDGSWADWKSVLVRYRELQRFEIISQFWQKQYICFSGNIFICVSKLSQSSHFMAAWVFLLLATHQGRGDNCV